MSTHEHSCGPSGGIYPGDCEFTQALLQQSALREAERGSTWHSCLPRAKAIKLLLLDVDGVLTDGSLIYIGEAEEIKTFHVRDGFGLRLLQEIGVEIGLITARKSAAVSRRAAELSLTRVYQGARRKIEVYNTIIAEMNLKAEEVAYMGDDWLDLAVLSRAGFSATVANAAGEVKQLAHYVAKKNGGQGAVREVCDLIIEAKGKHEELLKRYL